MPQAKFRALKCIVCGARRYSNYSTLCEKCTLKALATMYPTEAERREAIDKKSLVLLKDIADQQKRERAGKEKQH